MLLFTSSAFSLYLMCMDLKQYTIIWSLPFPGIFKRYTCNYIFFNPIHNAENVYAMLPMGEAVHAWGHGLCGKSLNL